MMSTAVGVVATSRITNTQLALSRGLQRNNTLASSGCRSPTQSRPKLPRNRAPSTEPTTSPRSEAPSLHQPTCGGGDSASPSPTKLPPRSRSDVGTRSCTEQPTSPNTTRLQRARSDRTMPTILSPELSLRRSSSPTADVGNHGPRLLSLKWLTRRRGSSPAYTSTTMNLSESTAIQHPEAIPDSTLGRFPGEGAGAVFSGSGGGRGAMGLSREKEILVRGLARRWRQKCEVIRETSFEQHDRDDSLPSSSCTKHR